MRNRVLNLKLFCHTENTENLDALFQYISPTPYRGKPFPRPGPPVTVTTLQLLAPLLRQDWPNTCLMNVGKHQFESFAGLENATINELLAVSCGVNGYVPEFAEWDSNRDYFGPTPSDDDD